MQNQNKRTTRIRQSQSAPVDSTSEQFMPVSPNLIKVLLERPIAFHPCLAVLTGSITSGLLLSQAVYWSLRTKDPDGWFYKTQEDWQNEVFLNRTEQANARQKLRVFAFWQEKKRGVPGKLYYRVDLDLLADALNGEYAEVTLEQVLTECARSLKQLSRAGYMRATKAKVVLEKVDYAEVLKSKGMLCGICRKKIIRPVGQKPGFLVFDHILPIIKNGSHTFKNLQPAHFECNARKYDSLGDSQFAYRKQTENAYRKQTCPLPVSKLVRLPQANLSASSKQTLPYRTETTTETTAAARARETRAKNAAAAAASMYPKSIVEEFVAETKNHSTNPGGLAVALHRSGEDDAQIATWLAHKEKLQLKTSTATQAELQKNNEFALDCANQLIHQGGLREISDFPLLSVALSHYEQFKRDEKFDGITWRQLKKFIPSALDKIDAEIINQPELSQYRDQLSQFQ